MSVTFLGRSSGRNAVRGEALVSSTPITLLGGIDRRTGRIISPGSEADGKYVSGRVFCLPMASGSSVGSYHLYGAARNSVSPAGIVTLSPDLITISGAVLSGIPIVTSVPVYLIRDGDMLELDEARCTVRLIDIDAWSEGGRVTTPLSLGEGGSLTGSGRTYTAERRDDRVILHPAG